MPAANDALVNKALRRMRSFYRAEKGQVQAIKPAERVQVGQSAAQSKPGMQSAYTILCIHLY